MPPSDPNLISFVDDTAALIAADDEARSRAWPVLVVDDDQDVHDATVLALTGVEILGLPLELVHAMSGAQAREVLAQRTDIAVVLLDVVMETPDAGLQLVGHLRRELRRTDTRIILRTGQPGYAPELSAIRDYDINDYKTKGEFTRTRLITTLTAAIRSYDQIHTIEASRRGLDQIVKATPNLLSREGVADFAAGVLTQFAALLGVAPDGLVCMQAGKGAPPRVLAAAGRFALAHDAALPDLEDAAARALLERAFAERRARVDAAGVALVFGDGEPLSMAAYLALDRAQARTDLAMLDVFCNNVGMCLENLRLVEQLTGYAYVDQLVGLPNRLGLIREVERRALAKGRDALALALVDIDRFSEINSALGYHYGDQVLRAVATNLRHGVDPRCYVARLSGDTFGVLGSPQHVGTKQLREAVGSTLLVGGVQQPLSLTLGLLNLSDSAGSGAEALKDANIALKHAKAHQRGGEKLYTPDMGIEIRERVRLLDDLRVAVDSGRLFVVYQPQVDLCTGKTVGAEALLRWRNDEGKFVPPDRFIPLAEYSGLIIGMGAWVLRQACHFQRRLASAGFPDFRIAVNVSVAQFRDPLLLDRVRDALRDTGIPPACLELEITESAAMTGEGRLTDTLGQLRSLGVQLAIDDFGTGYSSLSYLQRLPVDRLKIDKSFVQQLIDQPAGSIAEMVVQLGRTLGLKVIAEGVEDQRQAALLAQLGCDEAQGYLYARPMPPNDLLAWLQPQQASTPVA